MGPLRALSYRLNEAGELNNVAELRETIGDRLRLAQVPSAKARSILDLVDDFRDIARLATDVFRDRAEYSSNQKEQLSEARKQGLDAVRKVEENMGSLKKQESGAIIDLFLSYRAVKGWEDMITLVGKMPESLSAMVMVPATALAPVGLGEPS